MLRVVLGGGIASGKSTVVAMLRQHGARVESLDDIARQIRNTPQIAQQLSTAFGADILDEQGVPIPAILAKKAFATKQATEQLNSIMHPAIAKRAQEYLTESGSEQVRVLEVPLLSAATDLIELADTSLCVVAPEQMRIERAIRRGMNEKDAYNRLESQTGEQNVQQLVDDVIINDSTIEALQTKVDEWWQHHVGRGTC